ncbi:MAG: phage tail tube protein [Nitrososphaerales archaeon]
MARYLGIGKESTYGTAVNASYYMPIISENLKLEHNYIFPETVAYREYDRVIAGKKLVIGGWEMFVTYDKGIGLILKALLGGETYSSPTTGVGLHVFKRASSLPSLTVRVGLDDITEKVLTGIGINELSLELVAGELLKISIDAVGRDETIGSVGSPTFSTQDFISADKVITFKLDTTDVVPERFSLTIRNNINEDEFGLGSRLLQRLTPQKFEVEGEMDIRFLSTSHLNDFLNSNKKDLQVKIQGPLITGSYYNELQIDCDEIIYDAGDAYIDRKERIVQNLRFKAIKDPSTLEPIIITLQNNETSAY